MKEVERALLVYLFINLMGFVGQFGEGAGDSPHEPAAQEEVRQIDVDDVDGKVENLAE